MGLGNAECFACGLISGITRQEAIFMCLLWDAQMFSLRDSSN